MTDSELKPCPFCGNNNLRPTVRRWQWFIECLDCSTSGPASGHIDNKELAYLRWNNRAKVKCVHELVKERGKEVTDNDGLQ